MKEFYEYFYKLYEEDLSLVNSNKKVFNKKISINNSAYKNNMRLYNFLIGLGAGSLIAGIPLSIVLKNMDYYFFILFFIIISGPTKMAKNNEETIAYNNYFIEKKQIIDEYEDRYKKTIELKLCKEERNNIELVIDLFEKKYMMYEFNHSI